MSEDTVTVEPYKVDAAGIRKGSVKLADVVAAVAAPEVVEIPSVLPLPAEITAAQREALEQLSERFGKVVPTDKRELTAPEIEDLFAERTTLDEIESLATDRKAAIRTTILNHFDVINTQAGEEGVGQDREGHVLAKTHENVDGTDKCWSWEMRGGTPNLSPASLAQLDADGELDHKLYLAMTTPVRVVDENKILQLLADGAVTEDVLAAIRKASTLSANSGALFIRKAKTK